MTKSKFKTGTSLEKMLEVKPFNQLLEDGDVVDVAAVVARTGYDARHVHRLCREGKMAHVRRGPAVQGTKIYFLAWQLENIFHWNKKQAKSL